MKTMARLWLTTWASITCKSARDTPESRDGGWAALNGIQVLDGTRHNFRIEYPCHSPREKRWFLMSVTPLLGERGGAVVTHTDITTQAGRRSVTRE